MFTFDRLMCASQSYAAAVVLGIRCMSDRDGKTHGQSKGNMIRRMCPRVRTGLAVIMLTGACSEIDGSERAMLKRTALNRPTAPPAAQTPGATFSPAPASGTVASPVQPLGVTTPPVQSPRAMATSLQRPEATGSPLPVTGPPRFIVTARTPIARFVPERYKTATFTPVRPGMQDAKMGKFLFKIPPTRCETVVASPRRST
jgi:hypothetical protein